MADLKSKIKDVVKGDNYDVIRDVTNVPVGQALTDAWFSVKENFWDTTPIFTKHITSSTTEQGLINDTGAADTVGKITFSLSRTDTNLLSPYFEYVYDIQVKTDADKDFTPEVGILVAHAGITEAE